MVVAIGVYLLRHGLSRKSRLLRPEVLLINPDNPAHLKGRDDDVRLLKESVENNALVFLEGESGSGKSALVRSGLLPALTSEVAASTLLPIYINTYGTDWMTGPATQLAYALWRTLSPEQRQQLDMTTQDDIRNAFWPATRAEKLGEEIDQTSTDQPARIWGQIENQLGQTPLLIFDQFDDYQTQHRERFLRRGKWLTMKQLAINKSTRTRNPFWVEIHQALQTGHIHCLFVTRSDTFSGLEAVRFVEPDVYYLERLEPAFVIALLEELVTSEAEGNAVIAHPQAGWEALKEQLVNDLAYQHRILPIQARMALKGLIKLPYLSLSAYERIGRVEGLEAAYIEDGVKSAASRSGTDQNTVMQVLLQLVDQSNPEIPKTKSTPLSALHELTRTSTESLKRMLGQLDQNHIIRSRIENTNDYQDNAPIWSLYHDYLARAVMSAHRKTNRLQQLLAERQKDFKQATTWSLRWRALLPPWQLGKLILSRMINNLSLTGYYSYLAWSTLRFLPIVLVLFLFFASRDRALDWQARQETRRILSTIGAADINEPPHGEELRLLWGLTSGSRRLKEIFIEEVINNYKFHERILKRQVYISHALFGIDPYANKRREILLYLLQASRKVDTKSVESKKLCALWAVQIFRSAPRQFNEKVSYIAKAIISVMLNTTDWWQLKELSKALGALGEKLPATEAQTVARAIVSVMANTSNRDYLSALGMALGALGEKLPATEAQSGAKAIVSVMANTNGWWQLSELGKALGALGEKLPATEAQSGAKAIVSVMANTNGWWQLSELGKALGALGEKLPATEAQSGAKTIVSVMANTNDVRELSELGKALGALGEKLPATEAQSGAKAIVSVIANTNDVRELSELGKALGVLGEKLPATEAQVVAKVIVSVMANTNDVRQLGELGTALGILGERLPATESQAIVKAIMSVMLNTGNWWQLSKLGMALGSFDEELPVTEAQAVAKAIVSVMANTVNGDYLSELVIALGILSERLPAAEAQVIAKAIVSVIVNTNDARKLEDLGTALGILSEKLSATEAQAVARTIMSVMLNTNDVRQLGELGTALGILGVKLPATEAQAIAKAIVSIMTNTIHGDHLSALGMALGAFGEKLPATEAQVVAKAIMSVMANTSDWWQLSELGMALGALGEKLPATESQAVARAIVSVMANTSNRDYLSALGMALGAFGEKLPATEAQSGAKAIVSVMANTNGWWQLSELGKALGALGEKLPATEAQSGAKAIVSVMANTNDVRKLNALGTALGILGEKLPATEAQAVAKTIVSVMVNTINSRQLEELGRSLESLQAVDTIAYHLAVNLLKHPLAVDEIRWSILKFAEQGTGGKFDNLQAFVDSAKKNAPNLDWEIPPHNPFRLN